MSTPSLLAVALSMSLFAACTKPANQIATAGVTLTPSPAASASAEARIFSPGVISDERWQYRITFTLDGRTAYYTVADGFFPRTRKATIYMSHLQRDGRWGTPSIAPFSGTYPDIDPFITPDGHRLYFSSIRPLNGEPKADLDVFYMERTASGWGEPVRVGDEVNSSLDELYVSVDERGTLYVGSGPPAPSQSANWDIYSARPRGTGFAPREKLDVVNTGTPWNPTDVTGNWTFNPEISVDGSTLIFTSLRPGGYGYGDLYVSLLHEGAWSTPRNLGSAVNSAQDEFHPTLSRDGRTLYFARTMLTDTLVPSNFYSVPVSAVEVLPQPRSDRLQGGPSSP